MAKVLPGISVISALTAVKHGNSPSLMPLLSPVQKIIDMAMNGVGCRATARTNGRGLNTILRHLKTQAAVSNLPDTAGQ
jgi:transposase-like protein